MSVKSSSPAVTRERLPFRVVDADGRTTDLTYSSPRAAADHEELRVLDELPWFDPGQPLHNWMLHETDFYEEVEQIWGRRWGAEGIGKLREVLVSRPTENETRSEYASEWQYYYIEVPVEEYWDLAVNAVTLEPGKLVMNAGSPSTLRALEREGVEVIQVDFSESHKFAIAGLHCATLELVHDQSEPSGT